MAIALMMLPSAALAAQITDFGDGRKEAVALPVPGAGDTVHITIPAECHVRHVQLDIATPEFDPASPLYAESLRVRLGETVLYEFCGTGYGPFGRHDRFTDGSAEFGAAYQREGREIGRAHV